MRLDRERTAPSCTACMSQEAVQLFGPCWAEVLGSCGHHAVHAVLTTVCAMPNLQAGQLLQV